MSCETHPWSLVGQQAPAFEGPAVFDGQIKNIQLSDYKGKWKILFFYPLDFTFVCPTEITAFSDHIGLFEKLGCQVIGCSVDSQFSHLAWTRQDRKKGGLGEIKYPLLADMTKKVARSYGCLNPGGVAWRATYIIDDKDVVQHVSINNLGVGRNVQESARLVEAFQFSAQHGEVCPAGWTKDQDSMKPDPTGSQAWFNKNA